MDKEFQDMNMTDIEAKLSDDIIADQDKKEVIFVVIFIVLLYLFRGVLSYWLKFGVAIPYQSDRVSINIVDAPIQNNFSESETNAKTFIYTSLINGHKIKIIPQAQYKLSGLVVAYNHDFLFVNDFFDSAALYDLGCAWGQVGDKKFYQKYLKSYSAKTEGTGSRILWTQAKTKSVPLSYEEISRQFSHSHLVPANRNIMASLLTIRKWDNVEIEGYLVDMEYKDKRNQIQKYRTSMSRTDTGHGDRGNGSCETIYVTRVKIGNKVYK